MLIKSKTLKGYKLHSRDGKIGKAKEFYFDDQYWTVRYLVADTGNWLMGRQVLISPYALVGVNENEQHVDVNLTKKQIEESPSLDTDKPVSRQFEESYHGYYGWPTYWGGPNAWGDHPAIVRDSKKWNKPTQSHESWNPHLRSTHDVSGYHIHAKDGDIGHVEDFIIDDDSWTIRYFLVDTRNWMPGKKVIISPKWIDHIIWEDSKVFVNLTRETIKQSPEYSDKALIKRDYEVKLHHHLNREGYWGDHQTGM
ncbi:MAG: PRC-barrel domain containing protein [Deltaproteobacteria bacterium]|nr:PRC-barrel domain containing protein [Deltaproteobacteria bacterium]